MKWTRRTRIGWRRSSSLFLEVRDAYRTIQTEKMGSNENCAIFAFWGVRWIRNFAVPGSWEMIDILFWGFSSATRTVVKSVFRYHTIFTVSDAGVLTHHPRVKRCKRGAIEFFRARI